MEQVQRFSFLKEKLRSNRSFVQKIQLFQESNQHQCHPSYYLQSDLWIKSRPLNILKLRLKFYMTYSTQHFYERMWDERAEMRWRDKGKIVELLYIIQVIVLFVLWWNTLCSTINFNQFFFFTMVNGNINQAINSLYTSHVLSFYKH